jgi:hypothetical protein
VLWIWIRILFNIMICEFFLDLHFFVVQCVDNYIHTRSILLEKLKNDFKVLLYTLLRIRDVHPRFGFPDPGSGS